MNEQKAVVIGASGLIGSHLVEQMLQDDSFTGIRLLVRKKLSFDHPKLQQQVIDFNDINDYSIKFGEGDTIFCCVGATNKKVKGDLAAYAKVDFDIPVNAARIGASKNFKRFLIVSSVGADKNSGNFYLKLKGRTEEALKKFKFDSISIFRPGQLLGKRNEHRRGEKILQASTKFLSRLLFGSLKKYHSIKAEDVARSMIAESKEAKTGIHILEYKEMITLIR